MEELVPYIKEAVDRKQENMRRRRRRDALRLQLVRVLELIAEYGTFGIWLVNILICIKNLDFRFTSTQIRTSMSDRYTGDLDKLT